MSKVINISPEKKPRKKDPYLLSFESMGDIDFNFQAMFGLPLRVMAVTGDSGKTIGFVAMPGRYVVSEEKTKSDKAADVWRRCHRDRIFEDVGLIFSSFIECYNEQTEIETIGAP